METKYKIRTGTLNSDGYISRKIGGNQYQAHRITALNNPKLYDDILEFEKRGKEWVANHLNGDKNDNRAENLEVTTQKGNTIHAAGKKTDASCNGKAYVGNSKTAVARMISEDIGVKFGTVHGWFYNDKAPSKYKFSYTSENALLRNADDNTRKNISDSRIKTFFVRYPLDQAACQKKECIGIEGVRTFLNDMFGIKTRNINAWIRKGIPEQYRNKIIEIKRKL